MRNAKFTLASVSFASLAFVSTLHAGDTFYSIDGPAVNSGFGTTLAKGNLDNDGIDDIIVGAPSLQTLHGITTAYSGRTGAQLFQLSFAQNSGVSVASGGDVDGDGIDDVVITGDGVTRVRSGATGTQLWNAPFGSIDDKVLILGDINQDTFADVVVASPKETVQGAIETGVIRLYSGKTGTLIALLYGGGLNQRFGTEIANAGDVNNDNRPDFLALSKLHIQGKPAVSVVAGVWNDVIQTIHAPIDASAYYGTALAGGADFNADGFDDIVVGDLGFGVGGSFSNGRVIVYSGKTYLPMMTLVGTANSQFGTSVACVDDFNNDGTRDFAVGAPNYVSSFGGQIFKGRVTVFSGKTGAALKNFDGPNSTGVSFGQELCGMKADFDSQADLLVGDPAATTANGATGRVTIFSGDVKIGGWSNYGTGFAGALGVPSLTASGTLAICEPSTLMLANSNGANALQGLFFIGSSTVDLQTTYGGKLLVVPVTVVPVVIPTSGLNVPFTVCDTALAGAQFRLQAVELDPMAQKGVSFTRGLTVTLGL